MLSFMAHIQAFLTKIVREAATDEHRRSQHRVFLSVPSRARRSRGTNIKLTYGALHAISQGENTIASSAQSSLIALPAGGEPWGKNTRWRSVKARAPKVRKLISEMGVVLAASAFEDFLTNVISEHSKFSNFTRREKSPGATSEEANEDSERLRSPFNSLQWDVKEIEYLLPLYDYFVIARNCIVLQPVSPRSSVKRKFDC
jgi:hypothetical protein